MKLNLDDEFYRIIGVRPWTQQDIKDAHEALGRAIIRSRDTDAAQDRDWSREAIGAPPMSYRRGTTFRGIGID